MIMQAYSIPNKLLINTITYWGIKVADPLKKSQIATGFSRSLKANDY